MRIRFFAFFLLMTTLLPINAAEPIADFSYRYQLIRNGSALGNSRSQFKALPNGVWQYSSQATGTKGLAGLAGAGVKETSTLIAPRGQLELFRSRIDTTVALKTDIRSIELDSSAKQYIYSHKKTTQRIAYQPGVLDQNSLTIALMSDLRAGKSRSFSYPTLSKGKLEILRFKISGEVVLDTALGKLNTVRVDRIRDSADGRTTRIWFAKDRGYAPVLVQETEAKGESMELRIQALE